LVVVDEVVMHPYGEGFRGWDCSPPA
jgi:hypothetical protein